MNLFRSKEHVKKWSGFKAGTEEGILELPVLLELFSGDLFKRRLEPDYVSHFREYIDKFVAAVSGTGKKFWLAGPD
jgi:hypothetical protein